MKLNIGCGRDYRDGWVNTDVSPHVKSDYQNDIGYQDLPCQPEEFDEIYISGVLEQIGPNTNLLHAMNECWRVLKPGGKIVIVVPNAKYAIAHRDPMDVRKFTRDTFMYFIEGTQEYRDYGSVYGFKPWKTIHFAENERRILTVTMTK